MKKILILTATALVLGLSVPQYVSAKTSRDLQTAADEVKYTEIKVADLPDAVFNAIDQDYSGYTIEKAYIGTDGNYKVAVKNDKEEKVLYYSKDGEMVKKDCQNKDTM